MSAGDTYSGLCTSPALASANEVRVLSVWDEKTQCDVHICLNQTDVTYSHRFVNESVRMCLEGVDSL